MASKQISGDMSVFSIGGSSVLAVLESVSLDIEYDTVDGSTVLVQGRQAQQLKRGGTIDTTLFSTISDPTRVSALECTVFTIGGVDYLALLKSCRFSGTNETQDTEGATGAWKWNQYKGKKDYSAEVDLYLPATVAGALAILAVSATRTDVNVVLSMTINAVAITLPMTAYKFVHKFDDGEMQMYTVSLKGKAGDSASFPTAPAGSTSLLEKAFNAPATALAFLLTSHATEGVAYGGNMIFSKFSFEVTDGQLVKNHYTFLTVGAITATLN